MGGGHFLSSKKKETNFLCYDDVIQGMTTVHSLSGPALPEGVLASGVTQPDGVSPGDSGYDVL